MMVPDRFGPVVDRRGLAEELIQLLATKSGDLVALTTALQGAGGFGKTTLASEVCRLAIIKDRFPGGILWVTVGQEATTEIIARKISDLCTFLADRQFDHFDAQVAGHELGQQLARDGRRTLLVVDDVWTGNQLEPFLFSNPLCTRLITTREKLILPKEAVQVVVDKMLPSESRDLLTSSLKQLPQRAVDEILALTGDWPLLLAMVNGSIRESVSLGLSPEVAANRIVERLRLAGPTTLDLADERRRNRLVRATMEASLGFLDENSRKMYLDLGIFPEDVDVPIEAVSLIWSTRGCGLERAEDFCGELYRRSLLSQYRLDTKTIRLHDVFRSYLRAEAGADALADRSVDLLGAAALKYRLSVTGEGSRNDRRPWWLLPSDLTYLWTYLTYHLAEGNCSDELAKLCRDVRWIAAKARLLGPAAPLEDLNYLDDDPVVDSIRMALTEAVRLLGPTRPEYSMVTILLSRLAAVESLRNEIKSFSSTLRCPRLENYWEPPDLPNIHAGSERRRWANCCVSLSDGRFVTAHIDGTVTLWKPEDGGPELVFEAHRGPVLGCAAPMSGDWIASVGTDRAVRVSAGKNRDPQQIGRLASWATTCSAAPDGTKLAAAGADGHVFLWEMSGSQPATLLGDHGSWILDSAFSADGTLLVTAGADGTVKIWDTVEGRTVQTLYGHRGWVGACSVAPDGSWIASASSDGTARVWDATRGIVLWELGLDEGRPLACAPSPEGRYLAIADDRGSIGVWDVEMRQRLLTMRVGGPVHGCCWTGQGRLALAGQKGVYLFTVRT